MRIVRKSSTAVLLVTLCVLSLPAQQQLNNDAVVKLVKAGLSDELVVTTISSQSGAYDTSTDAIIALKSAGVSDKVVAAIIQKAAIVAANPAPQSAPTPEPAATASITPPPGNLQSPSESDHSSAKPRVYLSSASKGSNRNAERDQSMEMSKDLERDCPGVRITISSQAADYTILLNHIEHGLLIRDNQIQIANKDGDLISTTKEGGSIKGDVKKACAVIAADWSKK
jgi:hypothetical protein